MTQQIQLTALPHIPLIQKGDELGPIILASCDHANITLRRNDVLIIAQKIVSKAEGRLIPLNSVTPTKEALSLGKYCNKDPRLVELILNESQEIIRCTPGDLATERSGHLIVRHRLNYILANAGIDMSNIEHQLNDDHALLLPENPDLSCQQIQQYLLARTQTEVGVIINDSIGRAWRNGTVGTAIGVAGIPAFVDLRGHLDLHGRVLKTSTLGFADEVASAASLLMGQANEQQPIVHLRGLDFIFKESTAQDLIRPKHNDLFI